VENYINKKVHKNGNVFYYNAKKQLHRTDGPASEYSNGNKEWWINGQRHRIDGPAVERLIAGTKSKEWYKNGKLHRENGPAIELRNGIKSWWKYGKVHRLDGPAITRPDGFEEWRISSYIYSKSCHNRLYLFSILEPQINNVNPMEDD